MAYPFVHEKEMKEAYRILGVDQSAKTTDIRKAYQCLAAKYHPDVNPDDPKAGERFKVVQWAYQVLRRHKDKRTNMVSDWVNTHGRGQKDPFMSFFHYMREWSGREK